MSAANPNNNQPAYDANTTPPAPPPDNPYGQPYPQYAAPPAAAPTPMRKPWYAQWWVWAVCVLAVAAIAVGITLAVTSSQPAKVAIQPADLPETYTPDVGTGGTDGQTDLHDSDDPDETDTTGEDTGSTSGSQMTEIHDTLEKYTSPCQVGDGSNTGTVHNMECKVVGNVLSITVETDDTSRFDLPDAGVNYAQILAAQLWNDIHKADGIERFSVLVSMYGEEGADLRGTVLSAGDAERVMEKYDAYIKSADPNTHEQGDA